MPVTTPVGGITIGRPSVLQSHGHEDDEHDQDEHAAQRECPDLAVHAADLCSARPDAQPGLIGAGRMPHQQPGNDGEENGQHGKPILGIGSEDRAGLAHRAALWDVN